MPSLCLVCISLRAGGTERIVTKIANRMSRQHEVSILLLSSITPFFPLAPTVRLYQPSLPSRSQLGWHWYYQILRYLVSTLRQVKPDLVLCFGEAIAPAILTLSAMFGRRVLVFNRESPLRSLRGRQGILNPLTYPLAYRVVVQTRCSVEMMRGRYRLSRFSAVPNPIDIPDQVFHIEQRVQRILNVGTLDANKNQRALIQIFARSHMGPDWRLEFIGDGPDRPLLEQLVIELGLQDSVSFLGERTDVTELLQGSRIFAFTSLSEGFPNALAEALAAGCACISYDAPTGPSELIANGVNGLLVPLDDEVAFGRELERLMSDPDLQSRLAQGAREQIWQFAEEPVFDQFEQLINSALPKQSRTIDKRCDS